MSFILDALKKSEAERQNRAGAAISTTPRASQQTRLPAWAVALMGALSMAVVMLAWAWWRSQPTANGPRRPVAAPTAESPVAAPASGPVRDLAAEARR